MQSIHFKKKGIIICSGLSNIDSAVEYYEIEPNKIINVALKWVEFEVHARRTLAAQAQARDSHCSSPLSRRPSQTHHCRWERYA